MITVGHTLPTPTVNTGEGGVERRIAMSRNIHPIERAIRVAVGAVVTSMAFVGPANRWFLLGLVLVVSGVLGWCLPYQLLGIDTRKLA
jgi:hypothetical protein